MDRINADLETRTTPSGQTVNLDWRIDEDAPVGTSEAVELLLTTPGVNRKKDEALRQFLKERLEQARTDTRDATVRDRLIDLLDYRLWHRFTVMQRRSPGTVDATDPQDPRQGVGRVEGGHAASAAVRRCGLLCIVEADGSPSGRSRRGFAGIDGAHHRQAAGPDRRVGL